MWLENLIAMGVPVDTAKQFFDYHLKNRGIWVAFEKFALKAAKRGKRVGAKCIVERIRWEVEIEHGEEFKISNSYTAYYARMFAIKHPNFKQFFEFKETKGLSPTGNIEKEYNYE